MYRDILEPVLKKAQADNPVLPYVTYVIEELPEGWYHGKETNRLCTSKNNRTAQNVGSVRWMDLSTERSKLQVCRCGAQQHRICVGPAEATRTPQSFCRKRKKHNIPIPKKKKEPWEAWPTIKQQSSAAQTRVAGLFLRGIRSRSELKERRLISDSTHPGGFSIWLWVSPKLWGNSFIRPLLVKRYWFYRTWRTAHFWAYSLVRTENMFEYHLICAKLRTPFSWWGQSKRPHSNLGRCRCILFGTVSCIVILSAQKIEP